MRLSTKIFLILNIVFTIPATILSRYIFEGIIPTENGFSINFSVWAWVAIGCSVLSSIFGTIVFVRFLRTLKLSGAIFFSIAPLTVLYGVGLFLIADLSTLPPKTATAVRAVLNIDTGGKYNSILWAVLLTILYVLIMFFSLLFICRPVQKIEKITQRLGDGQISENSLNIGKSKQFQKIETALEKINYNYKEKENLARKKEVELQKFIPKQLLKFLGKSSILELESGNQVQKKVTTLFCFLEQSEKTNSLLSLEENFNLINSYLNIISPLVRKYDGFVDKYLEKGILAVFSTPERAIECSHAIVNLIEAKKQKQNLKIDAKISINTGDVIFGIVGDEERKAPSIVSDVVEFASKMEEINNYLGTRVIFSQATLNEITKKFDFEYRYIGSLYLDNEKRLSLFETLYAYQRKKREKLFRLKNKFEEGVKAYNNKEFKQAKKMFEEVLKYVPDDKPSYVYFNKASEKLDLLLS